MTAEYDITPAPDPDDAEGIELDAHAQATAPAEYASAFLIVTKHDGSSFATNDLESPVSIARAADLGLMHRACTEVLSDIETTKLSQNVMAMLQQSAAAAQEAAQAEKVRQALERKGINVQGVRRR